jgi:hypothetical protein
MPRGRSCDVIHGPYSSMTKLSSATLLALRSDAQLCDPAIVSPSRQPILFFPFLRADDKVLPGYRLVRTGSGAARGAKHARHISVQMKAVHES